MDCSSCVAAHVSGGRTKRALRSGAFSPRGSTESLSQPRPQNLSLDLDFFVQVADHEFKMPL
jgi:hypothetical protein